MLHVTAYDALPQDQYRSSVAFLAIPGIGAISQSFKTASLGLSLASVVIGLDSEVEEKLTKVEIEWDDESR